LFGTLLRQPRKNPRHTHASDYSEFFFAGPEVLSGFDEKLGLIAGLEVVKIEVSEINEPLKAFYDLCIFFFHIGAPPYSSMVVQANSYVKIFV
jgi:hypothetical protein